MTGDKSFMTSLLTLLNDDNFMKDVASQHCTSSEQVDVTNYLSLIEEILDLEGDQVQIKSSSSPLPPLAFSSTINELCCQITCEALHAADAHQMMKSLFEKLSSFPWDAKAVLTLSAFSVYYAENRHLAQIETLDYKLRLVAGLRGPRAGKSDLGELKNLIRVTLEFTKCTVEFVKYFKKFRALPTSINTRASFYQIILGVIGCSVPFCGMTSASNKFLGQDLSTFSYCVLEKYKSFKKDMEDFKRKNEEQRLYEDIKKLSIFGTDIVELMAKLFCTDNDLTVYSEGSTVEIKELKNKSVMLLISNLNLSNDDLTTLTSIYQASNFEHGNCAIMWVPMVEVDNKETQKQFLAMRSRMQWYACNSMVSKMAAKFIKEEWQFRQQTKVVVLNQQGKVENIDAMTMIHLWDIRAFPFTEGRANELGGSQVINWFELVVNDAVVPNVKESFDREELIFMWDSAEDSETITKIKDHMSKMESYISFSYKFFNINTKREKFLFRLENCISLMMQGSKKMSDHLKLLELYTSYKKQSSFAIVARGSSVIVNTSLEDLSDVLSKHTEWIKEGTNTQDFETLFLEYFKKVIKQPQCYEFSIPNMVGKIPECIQCPTDDCARNMETVVTFKCCHGKH